MAPGRAPEQRDRVCLGRVTGAHGVRGLLVVRSFTETPEDIAAYGPVETGAGQRLVLRVKGARKAGLVVAADGVDSREAAEALKGEDLFAPRGALPPGGEDEWYHGDLVGLAAVTPEGVAVGRVVAVANFGAGDLLEIAPATGPTAYLPFTAAAVPVVDIAAGRIVVIPPAGTFGADEAPAGGEDVS
jgi:16S rRNA processing protein RimM